MTHCMTHMTLAAGEYATRQRLREALYAFTTLGFYDLAADLAALIGFGMNVDVPHAFSEIGTATPAFLPTSAGPWKWAALAGPLSPEKLPSQVSILVAGS